LFRWPFVRLYETPPNIEPVLQLSPCRVERVPDCNVNILVGLLIVGHPADGDFVTFGPDVDDNVVEPPFALMLVRRFDGNPAADDIVAEYLELPGVFANGCLDKLGPFEILEADL
jgi:hypothetical protein